MGNAYSRELLVTFEDGSKVFEELPTPTQGSLERFRIVKISGAISTCVANLYTRKGACVGGIDRHCVGGEIDTVANNGGKVRLTTAEAHELKVGDTLLLKDTSTALDLVVGTVTAVPSALIVDTDLTYTAVASGYWQTEPQVHALLPSAAYLLYTGAITADEINLERDYENRDNQSVTARRRHCGLYLELDPDAAGVILVAYTVLPADL